MTPKQLKQYEEAVRLGKDIDRQLSNLEKVIDFIDRMERTSRKVEVSMTIKSGAKSTYIDSLDIGEARMLLGRQKMAVQARLTGIKAEEINVDDEEDIDEEDIDEDE